MDQKITNIQNRTIQYWFVDGLAECAAGLLALFVAIIFWILPSFFMWRWSLPVILVVGLMVAFALRLIISHIKWRSTYPRTGYIAPTDILKSKRSLLITLIFLLIFFGSNYWLTTRASPELLWSPGLAGVGFALVFTWIGALTKVRRIYFSAFLSLLVGISLALLGIDYFHGTAILAASIGLVWLYLGYRTHKAYVRQNPLQSDTNEE
jgi:MFS family permease